MEMDGEIDDGQTDRQTNRGTHRWMKGWSLFYVICLIWMKFRIGANNGPKTTWYEFEMAVAIF